MVGITIDCRLGNQLFQYAFIRALSQRRNTSFFVNETFEKFSAADYFDLDGYSSAGNLLNKLYFKLRHGSLLNSLQSVAVENHDAVETENLSNNQIYHGYFQSEIYFKDILSYLPSLIKVKRGYANRFKRQYSNLFLNHQVIAVHIRRGDYQNLNSWWAENLGSADLTLPVQYYLNCLQQVKHLYNYKVVFVSDDISFARSAFAHIENAIFAGEDLITDFQILQHADICVISNSSFAWWGAWLNTKRHKQIFCPKYWLGFKIQQEYPAGIIPAGWIQKEAEEYRSVTYKYNHEKPNHLL